MKRIKERQTAHLVDPSPWPILMSIVVGATLFGCIILIINKTNKGKIGGLGVIVSLIGVIMIFSLWIRDIKREGIYTGSHTKRVMEGLMIGYILFLVSEVMVFVSIFWTVLNTTISPNLETLGSWPPIGVKEVEALGLPLNNTIILLSSGVTITIGHNLLMTLNKKRGILYIGLTILLAIWFTINQYIEYKEATESINDSIHGSGFYSATGLHGIHILIGTIFITYGLIRISKSDLTNDNHIGLESGIIYWHFVDVVWVFLYLIVYNTFF